MKAKARPVDQWRLINFPRVNFPVMKYWNILIQKSYSTI